MIVVGQYQFADLRSGKITRTGATGPYVATTGSANCETGQESTTPSYWRAYFGYDTSGIPDNAQIDAVVCVLALAKTQPFGAPETFLIKYSIGDIVGAALDGDVTEWDAGALMVSSGVRPVHGQQINLSADGNDPTPYVNKSGKTDVKIWDASYQGTGNSSWGVTFNRGLIKCYLQVTYSLPSATATGVGTASCSAEIVADASATATGRATASCSAEIIADASATATGRATASCSAEIIADASATATGRATASCSADLILEPLAFHAATIAVASVDSATLAISSADTATIALNPDDVATRGQRRN